MKPTLLLLAAMLLAGRVGAAEDPKLKELLDKRARLEQQMKQEFRRLAVYLAYETQIQGMEVIGWLHSPERATEELTTVADRLLRESYTDPELEQEKARHAQELRDYINGLPVTNGRWPDDKPRAEYQALAQSEQARLQRELLNGPPKAPEAIAAGLRRAAEIRAWSDHELTLSPDRDFFGNAGDRIARALAQAHMNLVTKGPAGTRPPAATATTTPPTTGPLVQGFPTGPLQPPPQPVTPPALPPVSEPPVGGNDVGRLQAEADRCFSQGDYTRAQLLYEQVARRQPDNLAAHINLGRIHNFDGKLDEAIAEYQIAYRLAPQTAGLRCWLGEICLHKGDPQTAFRWLNEEIAANPNNAWAHSFMGSLYMATGDNASRDRGFRTALSLDPNIPQYRYSNGVALLNAKQHRSALMEFLAAIQMNPSVPNPYYTAAVCYAALGDKSAAIGCYERYVQLDPLSEWAAKARKEIQSLRGKN